jgi:hypothetical protein
MRVQSDELTEVQQWCHLFFPRNNRSQMRL